ncbi:MAG: MBL fold metallo-hydrolase [Candidatus Hydrothermae bacterium]|nr:MBL fold metallo-hydrolase [Candidatus Hydrothermae bacterium]
MPRPLPELIQRPIGPHVEVWGSPEAWVYWVQGEEAALLIDAGYTVHGPLWAQWIQARSRPSRLLHLLTHSHYDHLGGTPTLLEAFPEMEVGAHPRVTRVLASPRAVSLIQKLSREAAEAYGLPSPPFEPFPIHRPLQEGQQLDLGGVTVEVIETPGHTRDSLSFWILPDRILVVGEAAGVPNREGRVRPQFLADYALYRQSLHRLRERPARVLGLPHRTLIEGEEAVRRYLQASLLATEELRAVIEQALERTQDETQALEKVLQMLPWLIRTQQPKQAFLLNLRAMIRAVARTHQP